MKIQGILQLIVNIIFYVITGLLFILSLRIFFSTDFIDYQEYGPKLTRNPGTAILAVIFFFLAVVITSFLTEKVSNHLRRQTKTALTLICIGICALLSLGNAVRWIHLNPFDPVADQYNAWEIALSIVHKTPLTGDLNTYIQSHPYLSGLSFLESLLIRVFGNNYNSARYFNALCCAFIIIGLALLAYLISGTKKAAVLSAALSALFIPVSVYAHYLYGTIPAITCDIWAFIMAIILLRTRKKRQIILAAGLMIILLVLGFNAYRATIIAVAAIIVAFLLCSLTLQKSFRKRLFLLLLSASTIVCLHCSSLFVGHVLEDTSGIVLSKGIPYNAWILMGISSHASSDTPGNFNGLVDSIFQGNQMDYDATRTAANEQLALVINEYLNGTRSFSFFLHKIEYEWLDPFFGSIAMTLRPLTPEAPPAFVNFLHGPALPTLQKWLMYYLPVIYAFSALAIAPLRYYKHTPLARNEALILLRVFFCGGFLYCLLSEGKSRYALPFFVALIPIASSSAAYKAVAFTQLLRKMLRKA